MVAKWISVALVLVALLVGGCETNVKSSAPQDAEVQSSEQNFDAALAEFEAVLLADGDPINQSNTILYFHKELEERFDLVFEAILKSNINKITPAGVYVLAERLVTTRRDEALFWFAVATIRANYDTLRCADKTAEMWINTPPSYAKRVRKLAKEESEQYSKAGMKAVNWEGLFAGEQEPGWSCRLGVNALGGQSPRQYTDESEWPQLRSNLLKKYRKQFSKMAFPAADPVPWAKQRPPTMDVAIMGGGTSFSWLNADTLVFSETYGMPKRLEMWSPGSDAVPLEVPPDFSWCAGEDKIVIGNTSTVSGKIEDFPLQYEILENGKRIKASLDGRYGAIWASFFRETVGSLHGKEPYYLQSPFDCHWVNPRELKSRSENSAFIDIGNAIVPLREGDGFLVTGFRTKKDVALSYFADQNSDPFILPISSLGIKNSCIRYYEFAGAYSISVCSPKWEQLEKFKEQGCIPFWWFYPKSRDVKKVCAKVGENDDSFVHALPIRNGILKLSRERKTARGLRLGGVYIVDEKGSEAKIYEGFVIGSDVSPDGCLLAVENSHVDGIEQNRGETQIDVIDLCSDR